MIHLPYPSESPLSLKTRDLIISTLLATSTIQKVNNRLLTTCQAAGWVDAVRQRTLQLLRGGQCATYKEVMDVLLEEAWGHVDKDQSSSPVDWKVPPELDRFDGQKKATRQSSPNSDVTFIDPALLEPPDIGSPGAGNIEPENVSKVDPKDKPHPFGSEPIDIRIPQAVISEAIRMVKEALDKVVEIPDEDNGKIYTGAGWQDH